MSVDNFYKNKTILAPMVRVGTLPMRLLALEYGADIVYSEEIVDIKMVKAERKINDVLGTVDFIDPTDGNIIFRTCNKEKDKVIFQLGTADPERALLVGKLIENDVAGIDINMGCPKEFSIKGGMGAALMANPEKAKKILEILVKNLKIPVTCKIRILPNLDDTINFVKEMELVGIRAIAIHARTRNERPQHSPHLDYIKKIAKSVSIPVIGNGGSKEIKKYEDIEQFKKDCGTSSVMIARAAQWNASIFRCEGMLPLDDVIKRYLELCVDYDNAPSNTKYCVQNMLRDQQESIKGKQLLASQTLKQMCELWDLGDYCHKKQIEYQESGNFNRCDVVPGCTSLKNYNLSFDEIKPKPDIIEKNIAFFRALYPNVNELPKSILHSFALKNGKKLPTYETQQEDKLFRSLLSFDGKKFRSSYWEKNKKFAEQGAALVCILHLKLINKNTLIENGSIFR